jgi:hypothetical protein
MRLMIVVFKRKMLLKPSIIIFFTTILGIIYSITNKNWIILSILLLISMISLMIINIDKELDAAMR